MRAFHTLFLLGLSAALIGCSSDPDPQSAGSGGASSSTTGEGAGGSGGTIDPPKGPIQASVTRYDYAFDIDTAEATSIVQADVAAPGGDCVTFDCDLPAITSVDWNGAPAAVSSLDEDKTLHACGEGIAPPATLSLTTRAVVPENAYFGLDVGFSRTKNMDGGTFSYLLSWITGCKHFGPCDADPSRLAEFHFDVTHASGTTVLCPGVLTAGDTNTRCDLEGTLAPTYSAFAIAADPSWVKKPFTTAAGVSIVFYEVASGKLADSLDPSSVGEFFDWVTTLLGPFPYGSELRVAGAPTAWLGFEHPANILLLEDMPDSPTSYFDTTMHVLMHEVVHQWAGDRTTLATTQDFVWKEATAEYLAYVFEDEHRPAEEAASSLAYWDSAAAFSKHYPRPTDEPALAVNQFYGDVYGPGPMVLYVQLETMLGRPAVLSAIQSFLAQPGAQSVDALRAALEVSSGKDLGPYFDAWVFGSGKPEWPTLDVTTSQAGDQVTVTVTQQNASSTIYGCAVEVEVQGATTSARALVDFGVAPTVATVAQTVTLAEPVVSIVVDPDHRLISREASLSSVAEGPPPTIWIF